ncbi:hypothetical protein ABEG18_12995 [Alsobacter sp. KACC 23698]|uniref:Uncharacterized protein n=1 Tax=Alsobacter sp. KACC 23698 TaxID=3149229 RepID=A0AAU7JN52_9HYPH
MSRQWKRVVSLTISGKGGSLTVDQLKIEFSAAMSIGSKQNTATISIWNLTKSHRKMLGEEFDKIELKAGYEGGPIGTIFKGDIRDVTTTKDGEAEVKSELDCGDGDEGVNKGAISETVPAKTKPKAIIEKLVKKMPGVTLGQIKGLDDLPETKRSTTLFGWAFRELDELGRQHGFYWSIQNGQFEAVKADQHLGDATVISRETGMIGIPEITDKGIKVKALLNPNVAPNRLVDVRSGFLDEESGRDKRASDEGGGLFRVSSCTFSGTNRGTEFYVDIEGNRVQGEKVVK